MAIDKKALRIELEGKLTADREVRRKLKRFADEVAEYATEIAPVDEGEFKTSIKARVRNRKGHLPSARIESKDPKSHLLEYGTSDESPTPEYATFARTAMRYGGTGPDRGDE